MDLRIDGKIALVFGASKGLGKAVATQLVQEGAKVILASRNRELLEKTKKEIGAWQPLQPAFTSATSREVPNSFFKDFMNDMGTNFMNYKGNSFLVTVGCTAAFPGFKFRLTFERAMCFSQHPWSRLWQSTCFPHLSCSINGA